MKVINYIENRYLVFGTVSFLIYFPSKLMGWLNLWHLAVFGALSLTVLGTAFDHITHCPKHASAYYDEIIHTGLNTHITWTKTWATPGSENLPAHVKLSTLAAALTFLSMIPLYVVHCHTRSWVQALLPDSSILDAKRKDYMGPVTGYELLVFLPLAICWIGEYDRFFFFFCSEGDKFLS